MKRAKITGDQTIPEIIMLMSEGNPGAMSACVELTKGDPLGTLDILHLDDMNMRGPQIWVAFKDVCNQDVAKFRKKIQARDMDMISQVNAEMAYDKSFPHIAVRRGASRELR